MVQVGSEKAYARKHQLFLRERTHQLICVRSCARTRALRCMRMCMDTRVHICVRHGCVLREGVKTVEKAGDAVRNL